MIHSEKSPVTTQEDKQAACMDCTAAASPNHANDESLITHLVSVPGS